MTVGERVRARRLELGLSQRDLEAKGCSYAYISRVEAGQRTPSVKALRLIASGLKTTAHWLETGETDPVESLRERCRQLIEIAKEERRRTKMWQRRCEALEASGASVTVAEVEGLAESLQAEVERLRRVHEATGGLRVVK